MAEKDFPRGTVAQGGSKATKRSLGEVEQLFGDGTKKKKSQKGKTQDDPELSEHPQPKEVEKELDGLFKQPVTEDLLVEGVMGCGIVREVREELVMLETLYSLRVNLPATSINSKFTELLKKDEISLDDVFVPGQMVPFKVVKPAIKAAKHENAIVTCDPAKLNIHLTARMLVPGIVIHSILSSIEEKGAVLDIGLQSLKGFLPLDKLPSNMKAIVGRPIMVRVESVSSRVVKCSSFVEQDSLNMESAEDITANDLMPGTIVEAEPGVFDGPQNGIAVTIGENLKAFIQRRHLPTRLRVDPSRAAKALRCVVMFWQPNSQLLVLSAHPDIVAVSKPERRTTFAGYTVGQKLKATASQVVPGRGLVLFELPNGDDGKQPAFGAFSPKTLLAHWEEAEEKYLPGSEHQCRVTDYCMAERMLMVTTRKDLIRNKIVSYLEARPGEIVDVTVTKAFAGGVFVKVCDMVDGYIPAYLASDMTVALEKVFPVERKLKCLVTGVSHERCQVCLTARKSLIESKGVRITNVRADLLGVTATGVIHKVTVGYVLVAFLNGIKGVVLINDIRSMEHKLKLGDSLDVRVINVDVPGRRLRLVPADSTMSGKIVHSEASNWSQSSAVPEGKIIEVSTVGLAHSKTEQVEMTVDIEGKNNRVVVSRENMSDCVHPPFETVHGVFTKGKTLKPLVVLGDVLGVHRVTTKRFVADWIANNAELVPKIEKDIHIGQLVCAVVSQRSDKGLFVEVAGGSGAVLFVNDSGDLNVQVGQTVLARVVAVKAEKKRGAVSLQPAVCCKTVDELGITTVVKSLTKSAIEEQCWLACNTSQGRMITPGTQVTGKVTNVVDGVVFVDCSKFVGCIRKQNSKAGIKVGDDISCILLDYTYPRLDAELMVAPMEKNKKEKTKKNKDADGQTAGRVVLTRRDYCFVHDGTTLYVVPTRFHPNHVPEKAHLEVGDAVQLKDVEKIIGHKSLAFAFCEGDEIRIAHYLHSREVLKDVDVAEKEAVLKESFARIRNMVRGLTTIKPRIQGQSCARIKVLSTVEGIVEGRWNIATNKGDIGNLAVKLTLQNGGIGRLHVSELPERFLDGSIDFPLDAFIKQYMGKAVTVRVVATSKCAPKGDSENKFNIIEVTMKAAKLRDSRSKHGIFQYKQIFKSGDRVQCFGRKSSSTEEQKLLVVELNPRAVGIVLHENLPEDLLTEMKKTGELCTESLKEGQMRTGVVFGFNRKKGVKSVMLKLLDKVEPVDEEDEVPSEVVSPQKTIDNKSDIKQAQTLMPGTRLVGRVVSVIPDKLRVIFKLADSQEGTLYPTAISENYFKAAQRLQVFEKGKIYHLYILRSKNKKMNFVVTEDRFEKARAVMENENDDEWNPQGLVENWTTVHKIIGKVVYGFVIKVKPEGCIVEIGPGITGMLYFGHNYNSTMAKVNDVLAVKVRPLRKANVDALERILSFEFVGVKARAPPLVDIPDTKEETMKKEPLVGKKRQHKDSAETKIDMDDEEKGEQAALVDPGFDWTNSGFLPEDLAAVGKIGDESNKKETESNEADVEVVEPKSTGEPKKKKSKKAEKADAKNDAVAAVVDPAKPLTKEDAEMAKERALFAREAVLADPEERAETEEDFQRLLRKNPNSAQLWIRYMSFFLEMSDLSKARAIAERALSSINYRENDELFNVWTAYLNLEAAFGDATTTRTVFDRACRNADSYKIHKQLASIYAMNGKIEEADGIFDSMIKKFRANNEEVWILYGEHLMNTERTEKARDLMKRGITSLPKSKHTVLICRFAQLEYRKGDAERGRTLFESLVTAYPKKTDIWMIYASLTLKHDGIEMARKLLDRATGQSLSMHKLRPLYKKWVEAEQRLGDEKSINMVRSKAQKFLQAELEEE